MGVQAAVSFKVLYDYGKQGGINPSGQLTQGRDGWLYGTTNGGWALAGTDPNVANGVAFKINPDGSGYKALHNFSARNEGFGPVAGITLGRDGNFYGATKNGGPNSSGTIFKMTPAGVTTVLYAFPSTPWYSEAIYPPIQAPDGNLYGTTRSGGRFSSGAVYRLNLATKVFTILHDFKGDLSEGYYPQAPLLWARDGNLYGTTYRGGINDVGTVFRINPNGTGYKVIYTFTNAKGTEPLGPLVQGNDGNFYGATLRGGTKLAGTLYKLTPQGALTSLRSFDNLNAFTLGSWPATGLVLGSDGNFYGATHLGGLRLPIANGCGVLFKTSAQGAYSMLRSMNQLVDGCFNESISPQSSLSLHTNGQFYGAATVGGASPMGQFNDAGTVFRLGNGLPAFIKPDTDAAKVGATIGLLGEFSGVTKVTFNGINASFTNVSSTFITAKVPANAKTGAIVVTKGTAQVKSLKNFVVLP